MSGVVYIGDELGAAGFRLAGAEVCVPGPEDAERVFVAACARAEIVLISAGLAARVSGRAFEPPAGEAAPLVLIVAELIDGPPMPDASDAARRELGLIDE